MTDRTVAITPGSGDQVAFDDNAQQVKLEWGAEGVHTKVADASGERLPVNLAEINVTVPVSGPLTDAELRATAVPISASALPLPSGAATAAKQPALGTAGSASSDVITVQGVSGMTAVKVDGSAVTQPVSGTVTVQDGGSTISVDDGGSTLSIDDGGGSITVDAASLPLPTGAATAAKQPALGTAGSPSADVISIQGVSSMTAVKVDGSAVTQPVSGTFWQATQPVSVASLPLPSGAATEATLSTAASEIGATNESAAAGDTSASGLNGLFKRLLQRITTLLAVFPATIDTNSGNKSASTLRVVLATDQPQLTAKLLVTPDANAAVNIAQMNGVTVSMGAGASGTGVQRVTLASDDPAVTALANPTSVARLLSAAASTNATSAKGSAGRVFTIIGVNNAAAARFLKLYNKASSPTVGSDTPVATFQLPALQSFAIDIPRGLSFSTGIAYALTTAAADADTGALAAGDVTCLNIAYA